MTPVQARGFKVGDKFRTTRAHTFAKGAIITLHEDDGSEYPLFSASAEDCDFRCIGGIHPGAYEDLDELEVFVEVPANSIPLKVKRLTETAILPTYATEGSAAFDLYVDNGTQSQYRGTFGTGLAFEVPEDHVMLVFSRSGQGFKDDIRLANCVGVIDEDYRGELKIKLTYDGDQVNMKQIAKGDRIAQGIVLPISRVNFVEVGELSDTARGEGGFGSSGN